MINQEQLDSLPQLDRIEYRLIEDRINDRYNSPSLQTTAWFLAISGILMFPYSQTLTYTFIKLAIIILLSDIFLGIASLVLKKKAKRLLFDKYFKGELKHGKQKGN